MENSEVVPEKKVIDAKAILDVLNENVDLDTLGPFFEQINEASDLELVNAVEPVSDQLEDTMVDVFVKNRENALMRISLAIKTALGTSRVEEIIKKTVLGDDSEKIIAIIDDLRLGKSLCEILPALMEIKDEAILNQVKYLFQTDVFEAEVKTLITFLNRLSNHESGSPRDFAVKLFNAGKKASGADIPSSNSEDTLSFWGVKSE